MANNNTAQKILIEALTKTHHEPATAYKLAKENAKAEDGATIDRIARALNVKSIKKTFEVIKINFDLFNVEIENGGLFFTLDHVDGITAEELADILQALGYKEN